MTAHDGFTLHDLVSHNHKHNEANLEENRDGSDDNLSWNCGAEGPTDEPAILELRESQKRNMLATLVLSQGVPMICGGDEIGRTQRGNNNAYCQDNELSWHNWKLDRADRELLGFVRRIIALRQEHPVLRRRRFFQGRRLHGSELKDIAWVNPDGKEMTDEEWNDGLVCSLGVRLAEDAIEETDARGQAVADAMLLLLLNTQPRAPPFHPAGTQAWRSLGAIVGYSSPRSGQKILNAEGGTRYELGARSLVVLLLSKPPGMGPRQRAQAVLNGPASSSSP